MAKCKFCYGALGLIIHGMIADMLTRSPGLMLENVNFVKKVIFLLETLPWVVMLSALFNPVLFCLLLAFVYIELSIFLLPHYLSLLF